MKIILIGKGTILFNIVQLILHKKGLDIVKIYWDSNNSSISDLYYLKNLKKNIALKNSSKIKDFKLKLKSLKYSKISLNMNCKKIFSIFNAFSYYPFNSPLPRITIQLDKIREIKNISMSSSSRIHFKRYIKLDKKKFLIRSLDKKYIVVEIY